MTTTDAITASSLYLDSIDVRFAARIDPGGLASVHRDPENTGRAIVAINSHVRFRLNLEDCDTVARAAQLAYERGAAEEILSTDEGFYLYENLSYPRRMNRYRLCIGSPLRKTIHASEVAALAAVLTCFARHLEAIGA